MKKIYFLGLFVFSALAVIFGCAGNTSRISPSESASFASEPDTNWFYAPHQTETRHFPFPKYHPFFIPPIPLQFKEYAGPPAPELPESTESDREVGLCSGYRIQVFAGREAHLAQKTRKEIETRYSQPVFVDFEAPQYKVRFGNFLIREEADEFCRQIRAEGFPDAWVVKAQITSPR